jgi:ATP-dependent DNA helicase RecG
MATDSLPVSFQKLGLTRWLDVALHFPLRYENESKVWPISGVIAGQSVQIQVRVVSSRIVFRPRRMLVVEVEDDTGSAMLRFIYFKDVQKNAYVPGAKLRVLGEARKSIAGLEFIHPRTRSGWLEKEAIEAQPLVPVYPTTAGLAQHVLRRAVGKALDQANPPEWLPKSFLDQHRLMALPEAIRLIHQPPADAEVTGLMDQIADREGPAWDRIRLDELLAQQIAMRRARRLKRHEMSLALSTQQLAAALIKSLSFQLTVAQQRVWHEISQDLARSSPMQRLLQGDVGSGKTVIAALAAAQAVSSGAQVAVMAPTEILADQLFKKFEEWLTPLGVSVTRLTGSLGQKARRERLAAIAQGALSVVVGTQALIQKGVTFQSLGLVIVDEQHRFGVGQRLALRELSEHQMPHLLGMSATPIPRSLAMTYLADLDVSVLDERPPNRQRIVTKLMAASRRDELIDRLLQFLSDGGQAYWVCPVIDAAKPEEEREEMERSLQAIETAAEWMAPIFGDQLVVLHGRMSADEKADAMAQFASGARRLLLATTVIEVGVDVPKASLMVIEHAERFGLAQLHQLRGRIGRGAEQSTCILLFDEPLSDTAKARLKTLYETDDGFEVARRDLEIRGPGEFLGLRQSGIPSLRYSDFQKDSLWVELAVRFGAKLIAAEERGDLKTLGVEVADLDALVDRWAFGKEILLASG